MTTDFTEQGLERLICTALAGHPCDPPPTFTQPHPPVSADSLSIRGGLTRDPPA